MPKQPLQFRIKDESGTYYYVNGSGTVFTTTDADTALLSASIVDWNKVQQLWKRHKTYHGVMRSQAPDTIRFVNAGAKILRYLYNTAGHSEAKAIFEIRKLNKTNQLYYSDGDFDIDFSPYDNQILYVDVALMERGTSAKLNAFDDVEFPIYLEGPDLQWMHMDGILFEGKYNYVAIPDLPTYQLNGGAFGSHASKNVPLTFVNEEGEFPLAIQNKDYETNINCGGGPGIYNAKASNFISKDDFVGDIYVKLPATLTGMSVDTNYKLELWASIWNTNDDGTSAGMVSDTHLVDTPPGSIPFTGVVTDYEIVLEYRLSDMLGPLNFTRNQRVILYTKLIQESGPGGDTYVISYHKEGIMEVSWKYRPAATPCRAFKWWTVFQKLVGYITDEMASPPAESSYLTTDIGTPYDTVWGLNPTRLMFTSGDALRQLSSGTGLNPAVKISMKKFAKDAFATAGCGIGIKNSGGVKKVVLEPLSHFYQAGVLIADLGSRIKSWRMYPYTEWLGNSFKIGYEDQDYREVNGRYEVNSTTLLKSAVLREQKEIDLLSPVRADPYGAEIVRANLERKNTTDDSSDNDAFKMLVSGGTVTIDGQTRHILERNHSVSLGIPADIWPTLYNFFLSPKRNLFRLLPFLKSSYYGLPDTLLKWLSATKNNVVTSANLYNTPLNHVLEHANVSLASTGSDLLFKPHVFEFIVEVPQGLNLVDVMDNESLKYGVFGHTVTRGRQSAYLEGFTLEAQVHSAVNNEQKFVLLCSPNTTIPNWL